MLKDHDITYSVAGRTLVENATAVIPTGHKVGLVGRNGTGKTTLFNVIRGEWCWTPGNLFAPRQPHMAVCRQEVPGNEVSLIDTVLRPHVERTDLLAEAETATDPTRIAEIQTRLADIDAWSAEAARSAISQGSGLH